MYVTESFLRIQMGSGWGLLLMLMVEGKYNKIDKNTYIIKKPKGAAPCFEFLISLPILPWAS